MKTKSLPILLVCAFVLAFVTCKKEPDPNIQSFELTKEELAIGTTSATIEGTYSYAGVIDGIKVCLAENGADMGEFDVELEGNDFSVTMTGLKPATEYQYHYAVDYGFSKPFNTEAKTFTTTSEAPSVKILEVRASEDSTSFRIVCKVEDDGGSAVTSRGICWSIKYDHPTMNDDTIADTNGGSGEYYIDLGPEVLSSSTKHYVRAYARNARGLGLSEPMDFRTPGETTRPEVTTVEVSEVTYNSAYCLCNVRSDGGLDLIKRGVCYGESANPGVTINIDAAEATLGEYGIRLTGLEPNKDYHVHAFATNDEGTSDGEDITFHTTDGRPTVTTLGITGITETTATGGGNVTDQGYSPVTERGICWSTNSEPEISDYIYPNGTGEGSYTGYMTDLTPDQTYYVRAYARNEQGLSYGEEVSFTATDGLPEVRTLDVTDITATSAKAHGEVTDEGASPVTERGICWSVTNPIPTIADEHGDNGTGLGTYEVNLTNLTPGTTYYVRAYAKNNQSDEPVYGTSKSFDTEATCPTVETVGIDGTTVSGNVTDDGGASITERGVCWSTNDDPTLHYAPYPTAGTGPYSVELTDLEPGKTYKVKAYARNSVCPAYGEELTLTMEADPPTVQTLEVSNLGQNSAMGNGNVTNDGGAAITERGVCWSTSPMPDLNDSHAVSEETPDIGTFTAMMNGLIPNTHYYVRAYAKNSAGKIGYGNDKDFTTLQSVSAPTVITLEVTSPTQTTATGNGNVTDDGGSPITERGVCWGTNHNPDLNGSYNSCTTNGTGTYQVSMTGLTPGTTYYVRAYARNSAGLSYAENEVSFSTGAQQYTITVSASTGGSAHVGSTTGPTTGIYTSGQQCTVYAVSNSNYTFTNWTENGNVVSSQANYEFTVTANRNLVANFTYVPPTYNITVSANPTNGGTVTGDGAYQQGQSCTVTATANSNYTFVNWTENGNVVSTQASYTFNVNGNRTLVANFDLQPQVPEGAIDGLFTINEDGDQVYFSKGNLQYNAAQGTHQCADGTTQQGTWRFADNQWDYIGTQIPDYQGFVGGTVYGSDNIYISQDYNGWIDLFGWGTSGWNNGNTCYHPWDSNGSNNLLYGPLGQFDLTGIYAYADWGVYNSIYQAGDQAGLWRTLTNAEWGYVFNNRITSSDKLYAMACVNNVNGVILLPDDWDVSYYALNDTNGGYYSSNTITAEQWSTLELHGAVFLPAAGYRQNTSVYFAGSHGSYWSVSNSGNEFAHNVYIQPTNLEPQSGSSRFFGHSVRLVHSAQ